MSGDTLEDVAKEVSCYVLAALYYLLFLYELIVLILLCLRPGKINLRKRQRLLLSLMLTISFARGTIWATEVQWDGYELMKYQYFVHSALYSMPALLLVTSYSILLSYWMDEYNKSQDNEDAESRQRRVSWLFAANITFYIGEIILLVLALLVGREFYQVAQPNYLNVLYILCVIGVIVYGILVYRGLKSEPIAARSAERLRRMKRVLAITIIVAVSFFIRVIVNFFWPSMLSRWPYRWPFQIGFYIIVEIIPLFLIVTLLVYTPQTTNRTKANVPLINSLRYGDMNDHLMD